MKSKISRLVAVAAGVLLAMSVTTGSTEAQGNRQGGAVGTAVPNGTRHAPERIYVAPLVHGLCDERNHDSKPFKG